MIEDQAYLWGFILAFGVTQGSWIQQGLNK
jgi:hypothetical protein